MALGWIDVKEYPFESLLLLERFQIRLLLRWHMREPKWRRHMGAAVQAHPAVQWVWAKRCPEYAGTLKELCAEAPTRQGAALRRAEVYVMAGIEDFLIYTTPEMMAKNCDFIAGWDKARLFDLADFSGKIVLDVGAGSGRLAFAAAEQAREVYASEPVGMLREFMRDQIAREDLHNMRVLDGVAACLPFPDDTFDIVMSGHVVGDDYDAELAELTRVCKPGGWILDCRGDSVREYRPDSELLCRGFEAVSYLGSWGKTVVNHRWRVAKNAALHAASSPASKQAGTEF
ncbi:MAG: methyltransferase domain-containing protein [Oscillospiraceae bacterium]|jgi:2-polyprenyl-3-methyl-5-hydroxy-6-metoxy-1,4-benzoquinol methylase|nr:methyltransferase domain-containing protein [Oscillospiraceae bacterium]